MVYIYVGIPEMIFALGPEIAEDVFSLWGIGRELGEVNSGKFEIIFEWHESSYALSGS